MRRIAALVLPIALASAAACTKPPKKAETLAPASAQQTDGSVTEACVLACVERRQMEAVAPDVIEAGCRQECAK